ncbi:hypothetical protein As57867_013733, partial [Aphanomyces stellatus]
MLKPKYSTFPDHASEASHPLARASVVSKLAFSWVQPLLALGNQRQLQPDDIWSIRDDDKAAPLARQFATAYARHDHRVLRALASLYWRDVAWLGFLQLVSVACDLYGPGYVLGNVILALEASTFDFQHVLVLATSLFVLSAVNVFVKTHNDYLSSIVGLRVSAALQSTLFAKSLRLSADATKAKSSGEIANVFASDVATTMTFATFVGYAAFAGLAVIILILLVNSNASNKIGSQRRLVSAATDKRMKALNELFGGIQIIKFNTWEAKFQAKVDALRQEELDTLWVFYLKVMIFITLANTTTILVTLAVFATYVLVLHQPLTVGIAFSSMALLKYLQTCTGRVVATWTSLIQTQVSAQRIHDILQLDECDPANVQTTVSSSSTMAVAITDGMFTWDKTDPTPLFQHLHLTIQQGQLAVVHGAVGQGKSSLCSILLGEMHKLTGHVHVQGSVAYLSQQPWIQNTTIRENILFGKPYDRRKYAAVVEACALASDLAALPAGDRTEIGQKG